MRLLPFLLATGLALSACTMAPTYRRPATPVPAAFPSGPAYPPQSAAALPSVGYMDVFGDARLQRLIDQGLSGNRDLRAAVADIAAARAQYRIQRANLLPAVDATGAYSRTDVREGPGNQTGYSASVGATAFEIDLFGRIRSLSAAALNRYFATDAAADAVRIALAGDIAEVWLTYAADRTRLAIAEDTANAARSSVQLTEARLRGGVAPRTDLRQAQTILASAQADVASLTTAMAQDLNALQLLVGGPVDPALLPGDIADAMEKLAVLPAGLDSSILLRRPDVAQAEYRLRAANAEIGAARAALFPRIALTGAAGFASDALSSLFSDGAFRASHGLGVSLPIFQGGAGIAEVARSRAAREAAVADYEGAIQSAFRETADALARQGTIGDELTAQRQAADAAADTLRLTDARYRGGVDSFLASLDAQRSLYVARRNLVATQLAAGVNRVALYRALGGAAR